MKFFCLLKSVKYYQTSLSSDEGLYCKHDHHDLDFRPPELAIQAFGMHIDSDMTVVPGRILPEPSIKYLQSTSSIDARASWNLKGIKFAVGAVL